MGGFTAINTDSGGDYTGKLKTFNVISASQNLSPGDALLAVGTADATGRQDIDVAGTTGSVTGVLAAVSPQFIGESFAGTGLASGGSADVQVHVDPLQLFEVDVTNGPLVVANTGLNANMIVTAATSPTGMTISNHSLNATGVATTATLPWRIVQLVEGSDGVLGSRALVRMNNSSIKSTTGV